MYLYRSVLICLRNSQLNHARGKMKEELATDTLRFVKARSWGSGNGIPSSLYSTLMSVFEKDCPIPGLETVALYPT